MQILIKIEGGDSKSHTRLSDCKGVAHLANGRTRQCGNDGSCKALGCTEIRVRMVGSSLCRTKPAIHMHDASFIVMASHWTKCVRPDNVSLCPGGASRPKQDQSTTHQDGQSICVGSRTIMDTARNICQEMSTRADNQLRSYLCSHVAESREEQSRGPRRARLSSFCPVRPSKGYCPSEYVGGYSVVCASQLIMR